MFNCKYLMGVLCALLVAIIPNTPVKGSDAGSIAAGVAGAVGTAIIMNQLMQQSRPRVVTRPYTKRRATRPKNESGEAAYAKDPFAGESAPAGYAKPVSK